MDARIRFGWETVYRLSRPLFDGIIGPPRFRPNETERYFKRISASTRVLYHPIDLEATNLAHHDLRRGLSDRFGLSIRAKNFPYELEVPSLGGLTVVTCSVQLFFPDMLLVRLICHSLFPLDESMVFEQRRLENHPELLFITNSLVGAACPPGYVATRLEGKPLIYVHTSDDAIELDDNNRRFLTSLAINDIHYKSSRARVWERVFSQNIEHNQKAEKLRLLLLSKQGFLCLTTPEALNDVPIQQEIKKKENLFTLGFVLANFYGTFALSRQSHIREMDYLLFATRPYIKSPESTFRHSYSNTLAWLLISAEFLLADAFESARRFDDDSASMMGRLFDQIPIPKYASSSFWEHVDHFLGEDYVNKNSGGYQINIANNQGAVAAGPNAQAHSVFLAGENIDRVRRIISDLEATRGELSADRERVANFDAQIADMKREIATPKPNTGVLRECFKSLRNILEGTVAGLASAGLLAEGLKLLGS